jgi:DNA polymerase-3 subunit delta'
MSGDAAPEPDRSDGAPHPRHAAALYGQAAAEGAFLDAWVGGRRHHAWLIGGPRGVGKATLAWRIARAVLSGAADTGTLDTSPDHPVACRVAALSEPRLFLLRRPWQSREKRLAQAITIDPVRALKSFLSLAATDGGWRVVIVDAADDLNVQSSNALLKLIEEPPAKVLFLLVCHVPSRLLPTIRSRCRNLRAAALGPADLAAALAGAGHAGVDATALAELAEGSPGEAVRLVAADGPALYARIVALLARAPGMDRGRMLDLSNGVGGAAGAATYDITLRLIDLALARIAMSGAGVPPDREAARGEAAMLARLAPDAAAGRRWAALHQKLGARIRHARAVNLDPSGVIIDTVLAIDEAARAAANS